MNHKEKRAFKKYLHGGALLSTDEAREAGRIQMFGNVLGALNQQLAVVSAKFANQTADFSDYEQIAAMSKQLNDLFVQLVLGQLKYSMHLRETFLHKAAEVKDIDVTSGKLRRITDIALQQVLPTALAGTALALGATPITSLAVGVATLGATGELGQLLKAKYNQLKVQMQRLTYLYDSYKRSFRNLVNSFVYLFIFMPQTRAQMNNLFAAVEAAHKCQLNHSLVLDNCVRSQNKMERYVQPDSNAPNLIVQYEQALDNCRNSSQAISQAVSQVATYQGLGYNYIRTELQDAQTLQGQIDQLVLDGVAFIRLYGEYWNSLSLKKMGQPAPAKPIAPGPGVMHYGTDIPAVSTFPPPSARMPVPSAPPMAMITE